MYTGRPDSLNHQKIISEISNAIGLKIHEIMKPRELKLIGEEFMIKILKQQRRLSREIIVMKSIANCLKVNLYDLLPERYHFFAAIMLSDAGKISNLIIKNDPKFVATLGTINDDSRRTTILHFAAANPDEKGACLEILLKQYPEFINSADEHGYSPLHRAIEAKNLETVRLLLQYNAQLLDTSPPLIGPITYFTLDGLIYTAYSFDNGKSNDKLLKIQELMQNERSIREAKLNARASPIQFSDQQAQEKNLNQELSGHARKEQSLSSKKK